MRGNAPYGAICKQIRAYPLCGVSPRNAPYLCIEQRFLSLHCYQKQQTLSVGAKQLTLNHELNIPPYRIQVCLKCAKEIANLSTIDKIFFDKKLEK